VLNDDFIGKPGRRAGAVERAWHAAAVQRRRGRDNEEAGRPGPPQLSEAKEQAAAIVERGPGTLLRTLKALRELRRYKRAVILQNAGQVNVSTGVGSLQLLRQLVSVPSHGAR